MKEDKQKRFIFRLWKIGGLLSHSRMATDGLQLCKKESRDYGDDER